MAYENKNFGENRNNESLFSKRIKAGKRRTYFFDVRSTRGNDYFITITESKKRFDDNGYDRHKMFLYKEDFNKFLNALTETVNYVKTDLMPDFDFDAYNHDQENEEGAIVSDSVVSEAAEDSSSEGLIKTPERVAKAMQYLTQGYRMDAKEILNSAKFQESYSEMVIVKDIELYSMCEHHMLPFFGKAHIAYIPNGYITGLSKLARVVDCFARRMQVQERMTHQILDAIQETLNPQGVAVVIEAKHLCMMMRGVQKQNSVTTTSAFSGQFEKNETRSEFLKLITADLY